MRRPVRRLLVLAVSGWLVAGGCTGDKEADSGSPGDDTGVLSGRLSVLAASSLTEPFEELGRAFEGAHEGVRVSFTFAASSALARQVNDGAPFDVFASADLENMRAVVDAGNATSPRVVARNRLAILVEKGNPKGIVTLAEPGVVLVLVLCAPEVPCGRLATAAFGTAGVTAKPSSLEENVKAVVAKVTLGEADAGVVYRSDVRAVGGKAQGIDIAAAGPPLEAVYPMAVSTNATHRAAAVAWVRFVLSPRGRQALRAAGFLAP